jgi:hypothetical protein
VRRPCSHCSNVRCETPSIAANCACVSPALRRACAMGERGSTEVRLPRPALSSRTPSRTSCQISRLASVLAGGRPVSFLVMLEQLLQTTPVAYMRQAVRQDNEKRRSHSEPQNPPENGCYRP